jgi:predicted Zn-dependent peptidase
MNLKQRTAAFINEAYATENLDSARDKLEQALELLKEWVK